MNTVACCLWGDWPYGPVYVNRLYRAVMRNSSRVDRFVCMADGDHEALRPVIEGDVELWPLGSKAFPGNIRKFDVYRPENGLFGQVLLLDLDVIPVGNLDDMFLIPKEFLILEDLWRPAYPGGSVIRFEAGSEWANHVWRFISQWPGQLGKSERRVFDHLLRNYGGTVDWAYWQHALPGQIVDAKPRKTQPWIIDALPGDARMVVFHGKPRPHEVERQWIYEHWA